MKKFLFVVLSIGSAMMLRAADRSALSPDELAAFRVRLLATTTGDLDRLLTSDGKVARLKGKTGDGMTAMAFSLLHA